MKYRKKPIVIEAMQFDGTDESVEWLLPQLESGEIGRACCHLYIKTLEGVMTANIGDYIIKGVQGEFYPCKPDIFAQTYEPCIDDIPEIYLCRSRASDVEIVGKLDEKNQIVNNILIDKELLNKSIHEAFDNAIKSNTIECKLLIDGDVVHKTISDACKKGMRDGRRLHMSNSNV